MKRDYREDLRKLLEQMEYTSSLGHKRKLMDHHIEAVLDCIEPYITSMIHTMGTVSNDYLPSSIQKALNK